VALKCYFPSPKYEVGNNIASSVKAFEVFCEGIEASDGAKKHAFLNSLPEAVKFDMQDDDNVLHSKSYDELKSRALEVLSGVEQHNSAKKRLLERRQSLGESLPDSGDKQIRNEVLFNLLLLGLREKLLWMNKCVKTVMLKIRVFTTPLETC